MERQYAHARICTLLKNLAADGHTVPSPDAVDFSLLTDPTAVSYTHLPILGVVEPACRRAVQVTKARRVGLIATAASVRSGAYEKCIGCLLYTSRCV